MNKRISRSSVAIITVLSIASIFALATNFVPLQQQTTYAASPNTSDLKQEFKQGVNQDNLCHRSDGCKQATEGQQITGNDNTASGFNDQSTNASSLSTTSAASSSGTQGPAGAAGPKGEPGTAGPSQTAVVTQRSSPDTTILPNSLGFAEALCNPGEVSTGGGYSFSPAGPGITPPIIFQFRAANNDPGWQISAFNPGPSNTTIGVFAECLKLVP
jgi:hypothetical protein